jgi:hypothetical protein
LSLANVGFGVLRAVLIIFGLLFFFIACAAYLRFGPELEEFATYSNAIRTQFILMLALEVPPMRNDPFLTLYVVCFVLLCTLALLNFFLAIVVNAYTKVEEESMEAKTARGFLFDVWGVTLDAWVWRANKWPSKLIILRALSHHCPRVFKYGYAETDQRHAGTVITREEFVLAIIAQQQRERNIQSTKGVGNMLKRKFSCQTLVGQYGDPPEDATKIAFCIFDRLYGMKALRAPSSSG